jgi:hypothetical protein
MMMGAWQRLGRGALPVPKARSPVPSTVASRRGAQLDNGVVGERGGHHHPESGAGVATVRPFANLGLP